MLARRRLSGGPRAQRSRMMAVPSTRGPSPDLAVVDLDPRWHMGSRQHWYSTEDPIVRGRRRYDAVGLSWPSWRARSDPERPAPVLRHLTCTQRAGERVGGRWTDAHAEMRVLLAQGRPFADALRAVADGMSRVDGVDGEPLTGVEQFIDVFAVDGLVGVRARLGPWMGVSFSLATPSGGAKSIKAIAKSRTVVERRGPRASVGGRWYRARSIRGATAGGYVMGVLGC